MLPHDGDLDSDGTPTLTDPASAAGSAAPMVARRPWASILAVALQVGMALAILRLFDLENGAVVRMGEFALGGFLAHSILPLRHRPVFFLALSLLGFGVLLGWQTAAWVVGIGAILISLCHLPVGWWGRVFALAAAGGALAAVRAGRWQAPFAEGEVLPVLASVFMFRLALYLYETRSRPPMASLPHRLSYFFMLPNAAFLFFPIIDYATFVRTYHARDASRIHQSGVQSILRGLVQLIAYRAVYHWGLLAPSDIHSTTDLARLMSSTFLLYLRFSGEFHFIIGLLQLFGFDLPRTQNNYAAATSFTDFSRRINVYWMQFMVKLVYFPILFRARRWGTTAAIMLATAAVFVISWLLHCYQWFWLQGYFLITLPGMLYWGTKGLFVAVNAWHDAGTREQRQRAPVPSPLALRASLALRIAVTFAAVCALWTLWASESVSQWLALWTRARPTGWQDLGWVAALVVLSFAGAELRARGGKSPGRESEPAFAHRPAYTFGLLAALVVLGTPAVQAQLPKPVQAAVVALASPSLNRSDKDLLLRGYYEELARVDRFNPQLEHLAKGKNFDGSIRDSPVALKTGDYRQFALLPSKVRLFRGKEFHTNRWGMRDADYAREKPPGVFRIAVLGVSATMGSGVSDDETFEAVLERRLNGEGGAPGVHRFEILNFSVGGYDPSRLLWVLEHEVLPFRPDGLLYVSTFNEELRLEQTIASTIAAGGKIPWPELADRVAGLGASPGLPADEIRWKVRPAAGDLLDWVYRRIGAVCARQGIALEWTVIPTNRRLENAAADVAVATARRSGFRTLDLRDAYGGRDPDEMAVSPHDSHPSVAAHRLIADRLFEQIRSGAMFGRPFAGSVAPRGHS